MLILHENRHVKYESKKEKVMKERRQISLQVAHVFFRDYQLWIMVLPAVASVFIFSYIPMYGIQLAFREFDFQKGLTGGTWVGLKYILQFINNSSFFRIIWNTFRVSGLSILLGFPAPILMALLFNQVKNARIKKTLQTSVYIPNFISTVVMVAMINLFLSPSSGIIDNMLKGLGLMGQETNLLGEPSAFSMIYVLSGIWQCCGWSSIIYLAALSNVDVQLYDAAKIDGASRWRIMWHIDFVSLIPIIVMLTILTMGGILGVGFEKVFLMQSATNVQVSEVISTYTYKIGISGSRFSYGAAIGFFNTVINFAFLLIANTIAKKTTDFSIL